MEIINIHPGITDEEIWVFFDEISIYLSFSLLTEIFINRTFSGEKLEENIRLIGTCNPYRKKKITTEKCGLTREDGQEDELVYKADQLPQSLLHYVFNFGSIKDENEKNIKGII